MRGVFHCEHDACYVIHDSSHCPLCDARVDQVDLEDELAARLKEIELLHERIAELEAEMRQNGIG